MEESTYLQSIGAHPIYDPAEQTGLYTFRLYDVETHAVQNAETKINYTRLSPFSARVFHSLIRLQLITPDDMQTVISRLNQGIDRQEIDIEDMTTTELIDWPLENSNKSSAIRYLSQVSALTNVVFDPIKDPQENQFALSSFYQNLGSDNNAIDDAYHDLSQFESTYHFVRNSTVALGERFAEQFFRGEFAYLGLQFDDKRGYEPDIFEYLKDGTLSVYPAAITKIMQRISRFYDSIQSQTITVKEVNDTYLLKAFAFELDSAVSMLKKYFAEHSTLPPVKDKSVAYGYEDIELTGACPVHTDSKLPIGLLSEQRNLYWKIRDTDTYVRLTPFDMCPFFHKGKETLPRYLPND